MCRLCAEIDACIILFSYDILFIIKHYFSMVVKFELEKRQKYETSNSIFNDRLTFKRE